MKKKQNNNSKMIQTLIKQGKGAVYITKHASERLEERFGVKGRNKQEELMREILRNSEYKGISHKANSKGNLLDEWEYNDEGKYIQIVMDGLRVVTIIDLVECDLFVESEDKVRLKFVEAHERRVFYYTEELRRDRDRYLVEQLNVEIEINENKINRIRAKNPETRKLISNRLTELNAKHEKLAELIGNIERNIEVAKGLKVF